MDPKGLAFLGAGLGAGLALIGAGMGIGRLAASAMDGIARQPQSFLDLSCESVLECFRVGAETFPIRIRRVPCTQDAEGHFGRGEVRLRRFDAAPEGLEGLSLCIHHGAHGHVAIELGFARADDRQH